MPSQLQDQRLLIRESAPTQPRDHSLSASFSEPVIRLISTCHQVEECLLSCANCIFQPVDLCLLSPAVSAYTAVRYMPDSRLRSTLSRLISDYQPLDQHLSTTLSPLFSRLISACQPLDQRLSAARSTSVNDFISTCKPLKQHPPAASSVPVSCLIIAFSAARSASTQPRISPYTAA